MTDKPEPGVRFSHLTPDSLLDGNSLKVAFLTFDASTGEVGFHWLPDFFRVPMPDVLRRAIVERLRLHADKLECGDLERTMQNFININRPEDKHDA